MYLVVYFKMKRVIAAPRSGCYVNCRTAECGMYRDLRNYTFALQDSRRIIITGATLDRRTYCAIRTSIPLYVITVIRTDTALDRIVTY